MRLFDLHQEQYFMNGKEFASKEEILDTLRGYHADVEAIETMSLDEILEFGWSIEQECLVCGSTNTRPDLDFPDTMMNCDNCGSEWNCDNEITLNGKQ